MPKPALSDPSQDDIAALAQSIWEDAGRPDGLAEEHWRQAEQQLREIQRDEPAAADPVSSRADDLAATMDEPTAPSSRVAVGGDGLGEVSQAMIEKRAGELARMDGRPRFNEVDLRQSRSELQSSGEPAMAPEAAGGAEELVSWDDAPDSSGHQARAYSLEDEPNIGEMLVREGVEEAEHDQRVAASEGQPLDDDEAS